MPPSYAAWLGPRSAAALMLDRSTRYSKTAPGDSTTGSGHPCEHSAAPAPARPHARISCPAIAARRPRPHGQTAAARTGSFLPGATSTPLATSTAAGLARSIASATDLRDSTPQQGLSEHCRFAAAGHVFQRPVALCDPCLRIFRDPMRRPVRPTAGSRAWHRPAGRQPRFIVAGQRKARMTGRGARLTRWSQAARRHAVGYSPGPVLGIRSTRMGRSFTNTPTLHTCGGKARAMSSAVARATHRGLWAQKFKPMASAPASAAASASSIDVMPQILIRNMLPLSCPMTTPRTTATTVRIRLTSCAALSR